MPASAVVHWSAIDPPAGPEWIALVASYLLGAIPFGLVVARAKGIDLRTFGSGNIGATNAMRALGKPLGYTVFALDVAKGAVPVLLFWRWLGTVESRVLGVQVACGAAAVVGHCFPIYLAFKGGKGVATAVGALTAIDPGVCAIGGAVWFATFFGLRYAGLASISMGLAFPVSAWLLHRPDELVLACSALALLIVVRHRSNIARMLEGTEPKAGAKKSLDASGKSRDED